MTKLADKAYRQAVKFPAEVDKLVKKISGSSV
jgi:hypothetical protein